MHWMCRNGSIQVRRPLFASRCWLLANSLIVATGAPGIRGAGSGIRDDGSGILDSAIQGFADR